MLDDLGDLPASGDLVVTALPSGTSVAAAWRPPRLLRLPARLSVGRAGRGLAVIIACAVILLSQFTAGTATSHAALLPLARPPSVAPKAPIVLPAAAWQAIPLPFDNGHLRSFAAVPSDPTTLYACSGAGVDPLGAVRTGALILWRSRDAGTHWVMLPIPAVAGTDCRIQLAPANPARLALLLGDYTAETRACGRSRILLSDDTGATWRVLSPLPVPPTAGDGDCALYLTAHAFLLRYTILAPLVNGTRGSDADYLFRSGDDGTTWQRADLVFGALRRLAPVGLPDGDSLLLAASVSSVAPPTRPLLWFSHDDARTWETLGQLPRSASAIYLPQPTVTYPPTAAHPLYASVNPDVPHYLYRSGVLESRDGARWFTLPPLPVPGATPDRIGLTNLLGVAPDGRLLAFGAEPGAGVPPDQAAPRREPSQTLWAWDPVVGRWERLPDALPLPWPAHCSDQCWGAAFTIASDGTIFLTVASAGPAGPALLYRLTLPPSPAPTLAQLLAAQP